MVAVAMMTAEEFVALETVTVKKNLLDSNKCRVASMKSVR